MSKNIDLKRYLKILGFRNVRIINSSGHFSALMVTHHKKYVAILEKVVNFLKDIAPKNLATCEPTKSGQRDRTRPYREP